MMNFLVDVPPSKAGPNAKPLHELELKEVVTLWKNARRDHFKELNKTMSLTKIGARYGISRQAVSQLINEEDT